MKLFRIILPFKDFLVLANDENHSKELVSFSEEDFFIEEGELKYDDCGDILIPKIKENDLTTARVLAEIYND